MHPHETLTNSPGFSPDIKFETRLEAATRERQEALHQRRATMMSADARGELWTVQAAIYPDRAFVLIYKGDQRDMEPLESQHQASGVFLGPHPVIGSRKAAMAQALDIFDVAEITIRVIG